MNATVVKEECESSSELMNNFYNGLSTGFSQNSNILEPEVIIANCRVKLDYGNCEKCNADLCMLKLHKAGFHQNKKERRCTICGQLFFKKSKLIQHLFKHESSDIECYCCLRKDFLEFEELFEHLEEHEFLHIYFCHICCHSFALKSKFEDHLTVHSSAWKLPALECFKCSMTFEPHRKGVQRLKEHWIQCHSKYFKCDKCCKKFDKFVVFYSHCLRHLNLLPYACDLCHLGFRKQCRLKEHVESVHQGKLNYRCSECDKKFKHKPSFDAHVRSHDRSLCFSCNHCAKSFLRKVSLLDHFIDKSCSQCDEEFHCRTTFDAHFQSFHKADRLFECDECPKSYVLENALKRHKTLMHPKRGEKMFKCFMCLYETTTLRNLNRHKRRNH